MKIAIGPVTSRLGGVTNHILGIKKYSSNRIHVIFSTNSFWRYFGRNYNAHLSMSYAKILKAGKLNGYDVVHSHIDPDFTNLCKNSRSDTCKWIHTYHSLYFKEDYPNGLEPWQEKLNEFLTKVARNADARISVSKWLQDYLEETHSIQTEFIPNGVDASYCAKANPNRFARKYGLTNFILFIGYLSPVDNIKNPRLFMELAKRFPELSFLMIGGNPVGLDLKNAYHISNQKNLTLMNELSRRDLLDAMAACKAFVMTSKREGCPTTLLEAMTLGKPVVVPNHSGPKEIVSGGNCGFIYDPESINDLIEKTNQAITSNHVGEKARQRARQYYDWKKLIKKIDATYEK